jgi:hypothetical protein
MTVLQPSPVHVVGRCLQPGGAEDERAEVEAEVQPNDCSIVDSLPQRTCIYRRHDEDAPTTFANGTQERLSAEYVIISSVLINVNVIWYVIAYTPQFEIRFEPKEPLRSRSTGNASPATLGPQATWKVKLHIRRLPADMNCSEIDIRSTLHINTSSTSFDATAHTRDHQALQWTLLYHILLLLGFRRACW